MRDLEGALRGRDLARVVPGVLGLDVGQLEAVGGRVEALDWDTKVICYGPASKDYDGNAGSHNCDAADVLNSGKLMTLEKCCILNDPDNEGAEEWSFKVPGSTCYGDA